MPLAGDKPSGPDGEGQARGQARNARGEHGQPSEGCHPYSRFVSLETGEMPRLRLRRRPSRDIKNYPVSGYIYPPPPKAYARNFPAGVHNGLSAVLLDPDCSSAGLGVVVDRERRRLGNLGHDVNVAAQTTRWDAERGRRNGCRTLIPDRQYYA